jgi:hypothetical protein
MYRLMDKLAVAVAFTIAAMPAFAAPVAPPAAPEPTSMALLAAGIGGVAWAKFRRRK